MTERASYSLSFSSVLFRFPSTLNDAAAVLGFRVEDQEAFSRFCRFCLSLSLSDLISHYTFRDEREGGK